MKRQATDWEKIFANFISNKVLVYAIYMNVYEYSKLKTQITQFLKWGKDLKWYFTKEGM